MMDITTLDQFKDEIYGVKGTPRRDNLERELETLRIGVQIRNARQKKEMTQPDHQAGTLWITADYGGR